MNSIGIEPLTPSPVSVDVPGLMAGIPTLGYEGDLNGSDAQSDAFDKAYGPQPDGHARVVSASVYDGSVERMARAVLGPKASNSDLLAYERQLIDANGITNTHGIGADASVLIPDYAQGAQSSAMSARVWATGNAQDVARAVDGVNNQSSRETSREQFLSDALRAPASSSADASNPYNITITRVGDAREMLPQQSPLDMALQLAQDPAKGFVDPVGNWLDNNGQARGPGDLTGKDVVNLALMLGTEGLGALGTTARVADTVAEVGLAGNAGRSETTNALSNLGEAYPVNNGNVLKDFAPQPGFSAVYNPASGRFLAYPSAETLLADGSVPTNIVGQFGGHAPVNQPFSNLLGVEPTSNFGFSFTVESDGISMGFNSGMVNPYNPLGNGSRAVPIEYQQQIIDAVQNAIGMVVKR